MKRWLWIGGGCLIALFIGTYFANAAVQRYISARMEAQRSAIQAETQEIRSAVATERQTLEADKAAVASEKAAADVKKREAEAKVAELNSLLDRLAKFDPARQKAREDATHVPDDQVVARFRAALARLRAGPGR